MSRHLLPVRLLALAALAAAGLAGYVAPILPEIRQHLADGRACLATDPERARAHAMAVLGGEDLSVTVDLDAVPRGRRTVCRNAVDEALEAWEQAVGGGFHLRRADEGRPCAITLRFQPAVFERSEPVAGYVDWTRTIEGHEGRMTGSVQVRTVQLDGTAMPMRAMRHIVLHEMGHLLGLDDSDEEGEAMSPLDAANPVTSPSAEEADAVRRLRAEAERIIKETGH